MPALNSSLPYGPFSGRHELQNTGAARCGGGGHLLIENWFGALSRGLVCQRCQSRQVWLTTYRETGSGEL